MNNILQISKLSKDYYTNKGEINAICDITLDVKEGEFIAIVGPSGCGKSTLLNIIGGLDNKTSGDIIFPKKGKDKLSYMFQQDCLFEWLSIIDNCMLGLKIEKKDNKKNKDKIIKMLNNYGLGKFINSSPGNLSGGMRQRVG